jgi:hypothetical protein
MYFLKGLSIGIAAQILPSASASIARDPVEPAMLGINTSEYKRFVEFAVPECMKLVTESFDREPSEKCEIQDREVTLADGSSATLKMSDILMVKTKREVQSFCQRSAQLRYLGIHPGVYAREAEIVAGIEPAECINRIVLMQSIPVTLASSREGVTEPYHLVADILRLIRDVHHFGFAHTDLSLETFGIDSMGNLVLGELGSAVALIRPFRGNIELIPGAPGWMKEDLIKLGKNVILPLLRDSEVAFAIIDAIDGSSYTLGRDFDYDHWIEILHGMEHGVEFNGRSPRGHLAVDDASYVSRFNRLTQECLDGLPEDTQKRQRSGDHICPPTEPFTVDDLGQMRVKNPRLKDGDFRGEYGKVYRVESTRPSLMKVYYPTNDLKTLCTEKSMLKALNGFKGVVSRSFDIIEGVD